MIGKIGCRAHDYGRYSVRELVEYIKKDGYETMQLAFKKALIDVEDLKAFLTKDNIELVGKSLKEGSLDVSVLGAYLNYAGMDDKKRDENLDILKKHIELAPLLGCRMVGTETGSLNDEYKSHPDNHGDMAYQRFKDAVIEVMPLAEKADTFFAVEAVSSHIIHTPKRMHQLIKDVDDKRLKVIFDISNLMTIDNYMEQDNMLKEMFELLEEEILVVHVKDFDFVDGEKVILPLGEGKLNVELLVELVKKSSVKVDLLSENVEKDKLTSTYLKLAKYIDKQ